MTVVVAAVAGSVGAVARYLVTGAVQERSGSSLPLGTACVNLLGALALGLVMGAGSLSAASSVAAVGFLGGFTTFSTWMIETVRLGVVPRPNLGAVLNLVVMPALGVVLAAFGFYVTN